MRVVPYDPAHRDELRAVCLSTASEQARQDPTHSAFTLLMYCDPYLEFGHCLMLLDDAGVARGYVLCAQDYRGWREAFEPYLRRIAELGPQYAARAEQELAYYESVADDYPAHLHIDIEEGFTGCGGGRLLMDALLERLRAAGVAGVSFGMAAANERAVGFYRHMGFTRLGEYDEGGGLTFGMRFR